MKHALVKSTGPTWATLSVSSDATARVNSIATSPDRSVLYVCTTNGLYSSSDDGASFTSLPLPPKDQYGTVYTNVRTMIADPNVPGRLWASTGGGLIYSEDDGQTWRKTAWWFSFDSLAIDANGRMYLGSGSNDAPDYEGGGVDLLDTNNLLQNVSRTSNPAMGRVFQILVNVGSPLHAFAAAYTGLFESNDEGADWTKVTSLPEQRVYSVITANNVLYVGTDNGIFISTDQGATWNATTSAPPNLNIIALAANGPMLLAGGDAHYMDGYLVKLDSNGNLLSSKFVTGSGGVTLTASATDAQGNVFLTGTSTSFDLPTTSNAFQPTYNPMRSSRSPDPYPGGFYLRLDQNGAVIYGTWFEQSWPNAIATDGQGNAFLAGSAASGLPVLNPYQPKMNGSAGNGFVARFNSDGALAYSTYLGGSNWDSAFGVGVDTEDNVYVTGATTSADFPLVNPYQANFTGISADRTSSNPITYVTSDAFITKFNADGQSLAFSTYFGGHSNPQIYPGDMGTAITADSLGYVYVTGYTTSQDFPTQNAPQAQFKGGSCYGHTFVQCEGDGFVTVLNPGGQSLLYSTFIGGDGDDYPTAIIADPSGNAYVAGDTRSPDFPVTPGAAQSNFGGGQPGFYVGYPSDGFVLKLSGRPDFQMTVNPPPQSINGQTAMLTVNLASINAFNGTVSLDCGAMPVGAICQFSSAKVALGAQPVAVQLTVSLPSQRAAVDRRGSALLAIAMMPMFFVVLIRHGRRANLLLLLVLGCALGLFGCGGAARSTKASPPAAAVVPQSYTITVNGTSGQLQKAQTVTVTAQS